MSNPTPKPPTTSRFVLHELPMAPGFLQSYGLADTGEKPEAPTKTGLLGQPQSSSTAAPQAHTEELADTLSNALAEALADAIGRHLRIKASQISSIRIVRKSLDSRRRNHPEWKYSVEFDFAGAIKHPKVKRIEVSEPFCVDATSGPVVLPGQRIAIIGAGPAGLAAALGLSQKGYAVTVFEQGRDVKRRFLDIRRFIKQDRFDAKSNILFGEGGAGCFSDGKLTTRTRTPYTAAFLDELVKCGANPAITYLAHPHVGTDRLQAIIARWSQRCVEWGATFRFDQEVQELILEQGVCTGLIANGVAHSFDGVVFAAGLSAHPLYETLLKQGIAMERKGFAVGLRVEHPQDLINKRQLGDKVDVKQVGAAEYFLTWQNPDRDLAAYSFCMCPGGVVVPCADSEGALFTNGMSYSNRASAFANSAVVIPVADADLPDDGVLAGVHFQRDLERRAFALGGGGYTFPVQTMAAFVDGRLDSGPFPKTSFLRPMVWAKLQDLFPERLAAALKQSFLDFDRKIPGFIRTGFLTGPESRTSAPVRLPRQPETLESTNTQRLFPIGEGAGYSGGITSSGGDGLRLAAAFAKVIA